MRALALLQLPYWDCLACEACLPHTVICTAAVAGWVQPEKRERKQRVDYNQDKYFRGAMGTGQAGRSDFLLLVNL